MVSIYSGLDAKGDLLASMDLAATGTGAGCVDEFCSFVEDGISFSGTAMSVVFGGTAEQIAYGDITPGASAPVPEPSAGLLPGTGLTLFGFRRYRYR